VCVFRAIVHQQDDARAREALHQTVEERLRLAIDPVQVLEDQEQRLHLALACGGRQGFECPLSALRWIQGSPAKLVHGNIEEGKESGQCGCEHLIEREQLTGDLLSNLPEVVAIVDLEIRPQQTDYRQIGRGLAVGY
jgi:hypothetical protein